MITFCFCALNGKTEGRGERLREVGTKLCRVFMPKFVSAQLLLLSAPSECTCLCFSTADEWLCLSDDAANKMGGQICSIPRMLYLCEIVFKMCILLPRFHSVEGEECGTNTGH